ncbi:response regulator transcription factor [Bermanella marisrubri]|nr:response regulator transcription factor [Bermanella marisrubri]QIZ83243.1 response regulator transcription factor [Bermanella marisrubri]
MEEKKRILIIEDDRSVNDLLCGNLSKKGYQIEAAFDGDRGLKKAIKEDFDIILLDVMLPKIDGLKLLTLLRSEKQTPVLMLTAKGGEEDRIYGFKSGADDYLIKPFSMTELDLRIKAILRRTQIQREFSSKEESKNFELKSIDKKIYFNKKKGVVHINNKEIAFTPIEFELFYALEKEKDEVVSKAFLYQTVLLREFSRYDRTLDMHISKIRKKLTAAGMSKNTIKTIRGQGYYFESD